MNVIGNSLLVPIDTARADHDLEDCKEEVLCALHGGGVTNVLIDMSMVTLIDAFQADVIVEMATLGKLYGARTALHGVQPSVAAALALIQHRIVDLPCCQTIEDALAHIGATSG